LINGVGGVGCLEDMESMEYILVFIFFLFIYSGWNSSSIDILGGAIMFNAFSLSVGGDMYLCITSAL
jgi:hypothetical protein